MSTALSEFREPIRVLIGDNDADIQIRSNSQLDAAMRTVIDLGKVVGDQTAVDSYTLTSARTSITPTLTATEDPKAFGQLVYHTVKLFCIDVAPTSWRTRAFSETIGENRERIAHVLNELYDLENGDGCSGTEYDT